MFLVAGSMGREARDHYSVDGFGGRGHREVAVITNSGAEREFLVRLEGAAIGEVEVFQASSISRKRTLGRRKADGGAVSIRVPADSVTALVAVGPHSKMSVVMVVKDAGRLTAAEAEMRGALAAVYEVQVLSEELTPAQQDKLGSKRHPSDPMGTAIYLLSDSVSEATALAHRTVMAPVVAVGENNRLTLGVPSGRLVEGGAPLAYRHRLDPPAALLENDLPKACGPRAHWATGAKRQTLLDLVERMLGKG
jgi:hypothetical protein